MEYTTRTTLLEAVETLGGFEVLAPRNRDALSTITVHEWATYLRDDGPRPVSRSALSRDRRQALEGVVGPFAHRLKSSGRKLVDRHGPAEEPDWLEEAGEEAEGDPDLPEEAIEEAARSVFREGAGRPGVPDEAVDELFSK